MNELISIIVNAYNEEKHIKKCIDSIINQTYKNLEIVVINDGSTDNTLNILNSYNEPRLKIITHENKGLSLSRNDGIDNSKGKYVYFLDADDFIEQDTIEYLYKLIIKYNADIATCESIDIYNYNIAKKEIQDKLKLLSNIEMLKKILLTYGRIWNQLIRKDLFNNIRFPNRIIEDVPVTYKLALSSNLIIYSNQIKHYRLKHKDSIMNKRKANVLIDLYNAKIERYEYLKEKYPNLIENEIAVLFTIMDTVAFNNKEVTKHIGMKELKKNFNRQFDFKIFKAQITLEERFKLILFRISPLLYKNVFKIYIKIKRKKEKIYENN